MKQENKKGYQAFVVCACCGKTFKMEDTTPKTLDEHQENNPECSGYFNVEMIGR